MSLFQLATWIAVALAGAVAHEVAHWIVWLVTGRRPQLNLWRLDVVPRAGPPNTTTGDRVAAAAPYVVGLSAIVVGVTTGPLLWVIFGISMIQIPSRADVETMRGRVTWATLL